MLSIYELAANVMVFGFCCTSLSLFSVESGRSLVNDGALHHYDVLVFILFIIYGMFRKRVLTSHVHQAGH